MEKVESVCLRVSNFLEFIKKLDCKNILIVTHSVVATRIEEFICGRISDFSKEIKNSFQNAEMKMFTL